jgi:hypothetical protein
MSSSIENFLQKRPPQLGRGGRNFLASTPFLLIFCATDAPRGGLHLFFGHHKLWGPPAKMASDPYLKCSETGLPTLLGTHLYQISYGMSVTFISVT